jgi:hypothetical protein
MMYSFVKEPLMFLGAPGSASGTVSQRYGTEDQHPDLYQNVTDPQHWFSERSLQVKGFFSVTGPCKQLCNII